MYATKFVNRCIGGVTISITKMKSMDKASNIKENKTAPKTKSIWSIIGNNFPGLIPNLLFMNDPIKSPNKAPKDNIKPVYGL